MKRQVILVPVEFANQIINYLSTKPFNEVSGIINSMAAFKSYDVDMPDTQDVGRIGAVESGSTNQQADDMGKDPLIA